MIGFITAFIGQLMIREDRSFAFLAPISKVTEGINSNLYLSLKNPATILFGLFLVFLATIIYLLVFAFQRTEENKVEGHIEYRSWLPIKTHSLWMILGLSLYTFAMYKIVTKHYSSLIFWIWIISISIFTFILWKNEDRGKNDAIHMFNHQDSVYILILFAFAISVGAYRLGDFPAGWIADEGPFWKMARSIALGEKNPPFFAIGVFTFPISSSLLQGWIMRWAGIDLWGWRFASVFPAALTVIPLYMLACELFNRKTAVAASVMMIVNPYFLTFARLGYNNSQSLFPVTLCIYFLAVALRRKSRFYLWLAGLTAGLGFYTYFAAWLGLVVLFIMVLCLPIINRLKLRTSFIPLGIPVVAALLVILPRVLFGISSDSTSALHHKFWETGFFNTLYGTLVFGHERVAQSYVFILDDLELFYDPQLYGILLLRGIVRTAAVLFDPIGYVDHQIFFGILGPVASLFFIFGMGVVLAGIKDIRYLIPSIWFWAGFFVLGALASIPPRPTHLVAVIPAMSFISAIGLIALINSLVKQDTGRLRTVSTLSVLLVIGIGSVFHYFFMIPYAYSPANEDDYISWLSRQIPEPANLILIDHQATTRNPLDEQILKLTEHDIISVSSADLEADPDQLKTWKNFVVFLAPSVGRGYAEWLSGQIPNSSLQEAYATGQQRRGYVVTDLALLNTKMDLSLSTGITDLWNSPVRGILVVCTTGILITMIKNKRFPTKLTRKQDESIQV